MSKSPVPYSPSNKRVSVTEFSTKFSDLVERHNPFDQSSPMSLISMLPNSLKLRFNSHGVQEFMRIGEEKIEEKLKPDLTMRRIRINLWDQFVRLQDAVSYKGRNMVTSKNGINLGIDRMCFGVCYPTYFYDKIMTNDLALAYLFSPPVSYEMVVQESLNLGFSRIREILNFPIYKEKTDKNGKVTRHPDTQVADIILKTVAILDMRVHGAVPKVIHQQVESKNVNYNMNNNTNADFDVDGGLMDIADLDKRIDEIKKETSKTLNTPEYNRYEQAIIYTDAESSIHNE